MGRIFHAGHAAGVLFPDLPLARQHMIRFFVRELSALLPSAGQSEFDIKHLRQSAR